MKLKLKNIDAYKIIASAKYGVDRKVVYYLIKEDRIDCTEIDEAMFVVLTDKSKNYKKK